MDAILQTTLSNAFSWMKMLKFRLTFHWSLFLINNIPALVQIMAWRRPGDKPLSEPIMVRLPTHICVARPQWVKRHNCLHFWSRDNFCYLYKIECVSNHKNLIWFNKSYTWKEYSRSINQAINPLRPIQDGRHFADDIFRCIFLNENILVSF